MTLIQKVGFGGSSSESFILKWTHRTIHDSFSVLDFNQKTKKWCGSFSVYIDRQPSNRILEMIGNRMSRNKGKNLMYKLNSQSMRKSDKHKPRTLDLSFEVNSELTCISFKM